MAHTEHPGGSHTVYLPPEDVPFGSNGIRLTARNWIAAALLLIAIYIGIPRLWTRIEPLATGPDYRIPYGLSDDYWLYKRYAGQAMREPGVIPIVGDSVVWGQYVRPDQTLSHALNERTDGAQFANLGVNGSHPVALDGLVRFYGRALTNRKVILHYNPLWMTSTRRDLQTTRPTTFNHPQLVPQFVPSIPSYGAAFPERLGTAIRNRVGFLQWTSHLRKSYFENQPIPTWTIEHPYQNPLAVLSLDLPSPENRAPSDPIPWIEKDNRAQSFEWVEPEHSLQWQFFRRSVETLTARGNDVLVLLGPFNEHMLTDENRARYRTLQTQMLDWLAGNRIAHFAPRLLPTELYADASHPLAAGYELLADELLANEDFRAFLAQ